MSGQPSSLLAWQRPLEAATLSALALLVLFPFLLAVLISLTDGSQLMARAPTFWSLDFESYVRAFARAEFPGRDALFIVVVATLMIPGHVTLIPNYLTLAKLGLIDTYGALILPFLASGFVTFFLRQYFLGIPRELDDAARIDGATRWQILWRVILPIARPAIATMALFQFLTEWNSYLWPLIVIDSDEMRTLSIAIAKLFATDAYDGLIDWPMILAGAVIVMLPAMIAFAVAERHLSRGFAVSVSK